MYSPHDEMVSKRRMYTRLALVGVLVLLVSAVIGVFLHLRMQPPMIAAGALGYSLCYFLISTQVAPHYRYTRYLRDIREGLSRKTDGWFVSISSEPVLRDGVEFYPFSMRVGDEDTDDRLLYWDIEKPLPRLTPGQPVSVTSFGNYIIAFEA